MAKERQHSKSSDETDLSHKEAESHKETETIPTLPEKTEQEQEPETQPAAPSKIKKSYNKLINNVKSVSFKQFLSWIYSPYAVVIYCFAFNTAEAILYSKYLFWWFADPYPIICIGVCFAFLLVLFYERYNHIIYSNTKVKFTAKKEKWADFFISRVLKKALWLCLFIVTVIQVVNLTQGKLENPFNLNQESRFIVDVPHSRRATYFAIKIVAVVFNGILLCAWWSADISTIYLGFISGNIIQILIAISIIQINIDLINVTLSRAAKKLHNLFILTGCFLIGQSMIGICLSIVINDKNRLHELVGLLLFLYDTILVLLGLLLLGCTILSGVKEGYHPMFIDEVPDSIPILFGSSVVVSILCFACTRYFRKRTLTTNLLVEEYDLMGLTEYQKSGWAKVINLNKKYNAGISGEHIISLMENYSHSNLEGMTCKILRVYKDNQHEEVSMNPANKTHRRQISQRAKLNTAFNQLDREAALFNKANEENSAACDLEDYKPISKNALKKLQKKNKQKKQAMDFKSLEENTEEFYQQLTNTEALVLLTIIDEFDLCERIPGGIGRFLGKWLGKNGKYPVLVIKFGLLGFHWPFKRSTFFCSATKKPVARAAAVLYTISEWNKTHEKCTVLMDPMYSDYNFEEGVTYSGWYKIKLPNSHIIDLRPFTGKKPTDFFKAIKYRTQDNTFKQAKGEVWETDQFNVENCSQIINMNLNIANNRASSGQSSQLLYPDWEFISNLGNYSNEQKYRTLLYLKIDGKIIASCVIFRLGETMTSDIQGLDHENSKKYKAYFVMMQEVIRMGLEEKVSFIDFGPTTEEAKVSIGCKVVPLTGCIYPRNAFMGPIIKFAASKVDHHPSNSSYEMNIGNKEAAHKETESLHTLPEKHLEKASKIKECFNNLIINVKTISFKQFLHWLFSPYPVVTYCLTMNMAEAILYSKYLFWSVVDPYPIICISVCFVYLLVLLYERYNHIVYSNTKVKISAKTERRTDFLITGLLKKALWLCLFIVTILQVVNLTQGKLDNPFNLEQGSRLLSEVSHTRRANYFAIKIVAVIFNVILLGIWWSTDISTMYLGFIMANIVQILIAIAIIQTNIDLINVTLSRAAKRMYNLFILSGCFLIGQSMIGICLSIVINDKNRLNELMGLLIFLYDTVLVLLGVLVFSCAIISGDGYHPWFADEIPDSIPILFLCSVAVSIICFICTRYFRKRTLNTNLIVEEYDLMGLNEHQKQGWAKLLDLNKKYNAGISGENIISLMENYSHSSLEGMTCKILRVYKDNQNDEVTMNPINTTRKRQISQTAKLNTALNQLDREAALFHKFNEDNKETYDLEDYKPISKNALKKLQKKNKQKKQAMDFKSLEENTEEFYQQLTNTEALVLLTIIDEFDLCERIPGGVGRFLGKWLGKNGKYPVLVIKFGLLGFHWPFKRSTFFCSATKKPVARAAAVLYTISEWNKTHEKCTVLMDPMYSDYNFEEGVTYSGWYKIKLPNSHIIDLRPFTGKKPTDFFKAIKYRTQDNTFKQAKGEVWETDQFNVENCSQIINMNLNIANNRASSGQSSQLLYPDWEFISNLGNYSNEQKYRTLLYLKIDGKIIASCVIFRLGETMTSDIQGLDHENSKKYKAYFVMMQEVIRMGLEEKVSFIDFGPTTEEAKVSIGCKVVPLTGCIYPRNAFMGPIIKFAASKVDV
ncbi:hypothetical protein JA1_003905 [Spathaspora sp. JA1]|nr:hypothetical protein JA1_003905 [Spathaspora sp. JA1]